MKSGVGNIKLKPNGILNKQGDIKIFKEVNESNQCQTPVLKHVAQSIIMNSTQKRRALGDVLNTTKTHPKSINLVGSTPNSKPNDISKNKSLQKFDSTKKQINCTPLKKMILNEQANVNEEDYPEVETFHPAPMDTYNDLFEDGKLSSLFLKPSVPIIPYMPSSNINQLMNDDKFHQIDQIADNEWHKYIKNMDKTLKKKIKSNSSCNRLDELKEVELPSLDDLAFKIPDNF
jgi:hypothetical protein